MPKKLLFVLAALPIGIAGCDDYSYTPETYEGELWGFTNKQRNVALYHRDEFDHFHTGNCVILTKLLETTKGSNSNYISVGDRSVWLRKDGGVTASYHSGRRVCETDRSQRNLEFYQTKENEFTLSAYRYEGYTTTPSADTASLLAKNILESAARLAVLNGYRYGTIVDSSQNIASDEGETKITTTGSGQAYTAYGVTFDSSKANTRVTTTGQSAETTRTETVRFYRDIPTHENYFDAEIILKNLGPTIESSRAVWW